MAMSCSRDPFRVLLSFILFAFITSAVVVSLPTAAFVILDVIPWAFSSAIDSTPSVVVDTYVSSVDLLLIIAWRRVVLVGSNARFIMYILTTLVFFLHLRFTILRRQAVGFNCIELDLHYISSRKDWDTITLPVDKTGDVVPPRPYSFASRVAHGFISWTDHAVIWSSNYTALIYFGFDSCANVHYVMDKSLLHNYRPHSGISIEGLGGKRSVAGVGELHLKLTTLSGSVVTIIVNNVFYIPGCGASILSQSKFIRECAEVRSLFTDGAESILKLSNGEKVIIDTNDDLSILQTTAVSASTAKRVPKQLKLKSRGAAQVRAPSHVSMLRL